LFPEDSDDQFEPLDEIPAPVSAIAHIGIAARPAAVIPGAPLYKRS